MNYLRFNAALEGARLIARYEDEKTIRRVVMTFWRPFELEQAEWLEARQLRTKLVNGELDEFTIPIGAYVAKATFIGMSGNASAEVYGVSAAAKMSGGYEPALSLTFEASPEVALLTWLAASVKGYVEVELLATRDAVVGLGASVLREPSITKTSAITTPTREDLARM
jgi:hypothetical protein